MIEWVSLSTGVRPVPRPVATPLVWATAFGGALTLVALHITFVGTDRPGLALAGLSLLAVVLGLGASFTAAPGTAVLCWVFLNGFAIPPVGTLTWAAHRDAFWLASLCAAALVGTVLARIAHARAAYRRVTPGVVSLPTEPEDERGLD